MWHLWYHTVLQWWRLQVSLNASTVRSHVLMAGYLLNSAPDDSGWISFYPVLFPSTSPNMAETYLREEVEQSNFLIISEPKNREGYNVNHCNVLTLSSLRKRQQHISTHVMLWIKFTVCLWYISERGAGVTITSPSLWMVRDYWAHATAPMSDGCKYL